MGDKLNKWRVYCNTEGLFTYGWLEEGKPEPTKCFNDTSHTVNPDSINITDTINSNYIQIAQEDVKTGGFFKAEGDTFSVPPNQVYTKDLSWKYPINVLSAYINCDNQTGDIVDVIVNPDTLIGITPQSVEVGQSEIPVAPETLPYLTIGFDFILQNGIDYNNLGEIWKIDTENNKVYTTGVSTVSFGQGSLIKTQIKKIKNMILGANAGYQTSTIIVKASYLSPGSIVRIVYDNNSLLETKQVVYRIEYLF